MKDLKFWRINITFNEIQAKECTGELLLTGEGPLWVKKLDRFAISITDYEFAKEFYEYLIKQTPEKMEKDENDQGKPHKDGDNP